jgi:glycerophosphoryl diester phosphodiesterase
MNRGLIFLMLSFILVSAAVEAKNCGHRGGSACLPYPENTLLVLSEAIKKTQLQNDFKYLEFDIAETADGELVVFHDKYLTERMVPYNEGTNKFVLDQLVKDPGVKLRVGKENFDHKKLIVNHLTLEQLKRLRVKGVFDQSIPTLQEYLDLAATAGLLKPMVVEIKRIYTEDGRRKLIDQVRRFKEEYADQTDIKFVPGYKSFDRAKVTFLAFKKKWKASFGNSDDRQYWCQEIIDAKLYGVYKAGTHSNMCD